MIKTVNEHLLDQIWKKKKAVEIPNYHYKTFNKRINFLLRINQSHGGNQVVTMTEINRGKLNQIIA